jgi:acyl-CoA synthetase (AMP-forming)/AMP-acid ligase II
MLASPDDVARMPHTMPESFPLNIADRLRTSAERVPQQAAVIVPHHRAADGSQASRRAVVTFGELDAEVDALARGLIELGVRPEHRIALMVRPSIEFIALTFAIFRSGATGVLIDPGMGRRSLLRCLDHVAVDGFAAIPLVHLLRRMMFRRFRTARLNVSTGSTSALLGCTGYRDLLSAGERSKTALPVTRSCDLAAIIFTSGSTGPPKGVCYEHGMFDAQVDLIRDRYRIAPGGVDLPGFPLFGLFNLAMQVTTVIPDMNPARPAEVDPVRIVRAVAGEHVTQAYGSPAMWNRIARHCEAQGVKLTGVQRVLSAGAPVPVPVLRRLSTILPDTAEIHTPYGATECLPVASIRGSEVLSQTAALSADGRGTCVGTAFPGIEVRIIRVVDGPIASMSETESLPTGEIGEIVVRGRVATPGYFRDDEATRRAQIPDSSGYWHRMGDMGCFDELGRLWYCGRKAHVVWTTTGPLHSVCCEEILNAEQGVFRCALVGVGPRGSQEPVMIVEPEIGQFPNFADASAVLTTRLRQRIDGHAGLRQIRHILFHRSLPVDTRHNIKIDREQLAGWAAERLSSRR